MTARMKARLAEKNKPKPPPEPGSAEWFVALSPEGKSEFANQLAATYGLAVRFNPSEFELQAAY